MVVSWAQKIRSNPTSLSDAVKYYTTEYIKAKDDVEIVTHKLEREKLGTSHIFEHRLSQLQDIEAILKILNVQESNLRKSIYKKLVENGANSNINYLIDLDESIINLETVVNELAMIRNLYLGILKGLHVKNASVYLCLKMRENNERIVINYD